MLEPITPWQWWIIATAVAVWLVSAILAARRAAPSLSSLANQDFNPLVTAHDTALLSIRRGDYADAEATLTEALARIPPPADCTGEEANLRFSLLVMLATVAREWSRDLARELGLLTECTKIAAMHTLSPSTVTEDRLNQIYMMHMNRAVAAGKLKLHLLEEQALSSAFDAAIEPSTKCKCLAYQAWCILYQKDPSKVGRIEGLIADFDQWAGQCHIPPTLAAQIRTAEVMVRLQQNHIESARDSCTRALNLSPVHPFVHVLVGILQHPNIQAADALDLIWQAVERKPAVSSEGPLSPLPPGIADGAAAEWQSHQAKDTEISEEEFLRFEAQAAALAKSGRYVELEGLARAMLARHTRRTIIRGNLLHLLARALMHQDRPDEALSAVEEAIRVAHSCIDATMLVLFLDARAEIFCFMGNFITALRTCETAEDYIREADIRNGAIECWTSHTKGMAYSGCGWWEASRVNLQQAIEGAEHLREWGEWAGAMGDFVAVTLHQAEAEGPDEYSLKDALRRLVAVQDVLGQTGDRFMQLQTQLDSLRIRSTLAIARQDIATMWQLHNEFTDVMKKAGGSDGFFNQPGNHKKLVRWTVDNSRLVRALIEVQGGTFAELQAALDAHLRLLERATHRAPRSAALWQEKAALHLLRARCGLDDPMAALMAAEDGAETVMDIMRSVASGYDDPQVRAGWLGSSNYLFEILGEIGEFALSSVYPPSLSTVDRMISLAQYLRARSRLDIARTLEQSVPAEAREDGLDNVLARIRALHRWLESWRMPSNEWSSDVATEIIQEYPEYSLLNTRQKIEEELRRRKRALQSRFVGNRLLRVNTSQIEEEAPFDLPAWQAQLGEGEVVLDYYVGPRSMYAAILARSCVDFIRMPISGMRHFRDVAGSLSPMMREGASWSARVQHLRDVAGRRSSATTGATSLSAGMRQCSKWLFPEELVESINNLDPRRVYIVVSGPLWSVPFPWLDAGGQLVLQRWETCLVPSARLAGSNWSAPAFNRAVAVGHPGRPPYRHLAGAEAETQALAGLLGCPVLFEAAATPRAVLEKALPSADILHFACHGQCDPISPLTSALLLEPDDEHPDGRLMLYEILGTPLRAGIVILGACRTARIEGPRTFPESLAHAFLGGGAHYVIASLWDALDEECLTFAASFCRLLAEGAEPATAFRQAQLRQAERVGISSLGRDYGSLNERDFARFANFVLFSARKPQERDAA